MGKGAWKKHLHKHGEIVKPKKGRKTSNYSSITGIISAKVHSTTLSEWEKPKMTISAIKWKGGAASYSYGGKINVYQDAFEPFVETEKYSIF